MDWLRERLFEIIRKGTGLVEGKRLLHEDDSLVDIGLDSMNVMAMALDIEKAFAITIPDELFTAETFRSPRSLEEAIRALQRDQQL